MAPSPTFARVRTFKRDAVNVLSANRGLAFCLIAPFAYAIPDCGITTKRQSFCRPNRHGNHRITLGNCAASVVWFWG